MQVLGRGRCAVFFAPGFAASFFAGFAAPAAFFPAALAGFAASFFAGFCTSFFAGLATFLAGFGAMARNFSASSQCGYLSAVLQSFWEMSAD